MDLATVKKLETRNDKLIKAVIQKAQACCPEYIDLIGITGSFNTGDIHEKSDLDLLIVVNDVTATQTIATCFILEDVGFDFYCSEWSRFENMANFTDPHIAKLMDLKIVYSRNDKVLERYKTLKNLCKDNLTKHNENATKAQKYLELALAEHSKIILSDDIGVGRFHTFLMIKNLEYSLYLLNNLYIKKGIKHIPEELSSFPLIPNNFLNIYKNVFTSISLVDLSERSTVLIKICRDFVKEKVAYLQRHEALANGDLEGTYEEIYSNWLNKMNRAAKDHDIHTAFMTMASCQEFYLEESKKYNLPLIQILQEFDPTDLDKTVLSFKNGMDAWKNICVRNEVKIKKYDSIENFKSEYLGNNVTGVK